MNKKVILLATAVVIVPTTAQARTSHSLPPVKRVHLYPYASSKAYKQELKQFNRTAGVSVLHYTYKHKN